MPYVFFSLCFNVFIFIFYAIVFLYESPINFTKFYIGFFSFLTSSYSKVSV